MVPLYEYIWKYEHAKYVNRPTASIDQQKPLVYINLYDIEV